MKISFLGGGNMANALIGGLIKQGFAGSDIEVIEPYAENRERLARDFGVTVCAHVDQAALSGTLLVLAVKPQQMKEAIAPLQGRLHTQVVVSIAAGLRINSLANWLGGYNKIVRCMPNTPAMIGAGVTGLCATSSVSFNEREAAERVLQTAGATLWVEDEAQMDAVTAVSGSGPAYVFMFMEALQEASLQLGFTPEQARQLAVDTVLGSAKLAAASDEPASVLRERVTSKGGTTEAALRTMDAQGVKAGIIAGVMAAQARGKELGDLLGNS
jgi:pyrroline-5-carboxylate reductase